GAQAEAADLRGRDVNIVGPRQIVRLWRAQEAKAVRQTLDDAFPAHIGFAHRELLEDAEHQLLLAHRRSVLDLELLGKGDQLRRSFGLELLEFHFTHSECPIGNLGQRRRWETASLTRERAAGLGVGRSFGPGPPMHQSAPVHWSQNSAASAYVGWDGAKIRKDRSSSKRRD